MIKTFFVLMLIAFSHTASAQGIRLNGYAGYVFGDDVDSYYDPSSYYNGRIEGGFQWGVGLEFMVKPEYGVELTYLRLDAKAPMNYYKNGPKFTEFDLGSNYVMIGGNRYLRKSGSKLEGFFGFQLGANFAGLDNPDNGTSSTKTFFAWGIKGGGNIWASEKVALKLQASLLSSVQSVGGGFYFGTGGVGAGAVSYSTIYQFGLGGGLVFKLK